MFYFMSWLVYYYEYLSSKWILVIYRGSLYHTYCSLIV